MFFLNHNNLLQQPLIIPQSNFLINQINDSVQMEDKNLITTGSLQVKKTLVKTRVDLLMLLPAL